MEVYKKVSVYYRDLPNEIENLVFSDGLMSYIKEGAMMCDGIGQRMPRLTIYIKPSNNADAKADKKRLDLLSQRLDYLCKSNQIITYNIS
jgi:hypothetical protein